MFKELSQLKRAPSLLRKFIDSSASGGLVLMGTALFALVIANSPLRHIYFDTLHQYVGGLSVLHWINDGLMAVFFLMVGLEIKREFLDGHLSTWSRRVLPSVAALGGMIVPALIYLSFNLGDDGQPKGWAIPAATDIAFALGILSLLGPRVPLTLRVFLTALAIIDDLGAVLMIALFYTSSINFLALGGAAALTAILIFMNKSKINNLWPYLLTGGLLWFLFLQSGVHATLAGVILALCIPLNKSPARADDLHSPLHKLEHAIAPWVTFLIVPIFGFANAGVSFLDMSMAQILNPVPLGVIMGLFLGKQFGVFLFSAAAIKLGWADLPMHVGWRQLYGVSILCGVGFTMSLFIGLLAFPDVPLLQDEVKLGVLIGSVLSAALGAALIRSAKTRGG